MALNSSATAQPIANPMSLAGRTIIVTGAAQGIGNAVAEGIVQLGGNVVLVDLNAVGLKAASDAMPEGRSSVEVGGVSDANFINQVVENAIAKFGAIHGLVNSAGIIRPAVIHKMTIEQWNQVIDVHLTGSFLFAQAVSADMIARAKGGEANAGSIVNVSSDAGVQGTIGQINYATAKAGILGATMSMAREWAQFGVRANSVSFGMVETPMTETIRGDKFRDMYLAKIPMKRWASTEEAATPICFLLSNAASYITGQRISVNGGNQMNP